MRVLIFEPQHAGHNLAYVSRLCEGVQTLGCEVHLATSRQAAASEQFEQHLGARRNLRVLPLDGFHQRAGSGVIRVNGPKGVRSLHRGFWNALQEVKPDHVFVPFGNPISNWYGLPNRVSRYLKANQIETELVLLFGRYAYPLDGLRSRCKQRYALSMLQRGPWTKIHHILPHAVRVISSFSRQLQAKTNYLPDPVDPLPSIDRQQARQLIGVPADGRYITMMGLIEERKGVHQLLAAFRTALPNLQPNDRVLLAGKASEDVRLALSENYADLVASQRIIALDRHLDGQAFGASCCASNLICTPYPRHQYSASIVIQAAAAGLPVLGNAVGWIDETIRTYQLGTTCDTNDPACFAKQLSIAVNTSDDFTPAVDIDQFVQRHSVDNFKTLLTARLRERLGVEAGNDSLLERRAAS